jgi:holo-[acyl-carrier protein] synthase
MIYGIGTDIIQISRIEAALQRQGQRFAEKILGTDELTIYLQRSERHARLGVRYLATRYAAKEAFSKAIGIGIRPPMSWRAMQTLNQDNGKPVVVVSDVLQQWMTERGLQVQISISDEAEYAVAFVILDQHLPQDLSP